MKKKTNEKFLLEIKKMNPTYDILSEYVNIDTPVNCYCNIHNVGFSSIPYNLLKGKCGCEKCRREKIGKKNKKTKEKFLDQLSQINNNIDVIGEYINCKNNIECKCKIHNETFFSSPDHLLRGETGCKKCLGEKLRKVNLKSHNDFVLQLNNINKSINVLGVYTGSHDRIKVECLNCGNVWSPKASSLISGYGCHSCFSSRGEKRIKEYLQNNSIDYEPQKKFDNLLGVGNKHLSYDFYLPKFNLLIEYQGQFHDGTAPQQTKEEFTIQKEHDKRKAMYAKDNNIQFLEIWYWNYDKVEQILNNTLNNLETL